MLLGVSMNAQYRVLVDNSKTKAQLEAGGLNFNYLYIPSDDNSKIYFSSNGDPVQLETGIAGDTTGLGDVNDPASTGIIYGMLKDTTLGGNINLFDDPDFESITGWSISSTANVSFRGIKAPDPVRFVTKVILNLSSTRTVRFMHQNNNATADNRFQCPNNTTFSIQENGSATIAYIPSLSRWFVLENNN